jgi:hypothetical protein
MFGTAAETKQIAVSVSPQAPRHPSLDAHCTRGALEKSVASLLEPHTFCFSLSVSIPLRSITEVGQQPFTVVQATWAAVNHPTRELVDSKFHPQSEINSAYLTKQTTSLVCFAPRTDID